MADINQLFRTVAALKRGKQDGRAKPHKLVMLLAVCDMIEDGVLSSNRVFFDQQLVNHFRRRFIEVANDSDWLQPSLPFFHLRSADFWHHKIFPGREDIYNSLSTSGGGSKRITENIEYAYFDEDFYEGLVDPQSRDLLRQYIIQLLAKSGEGELVDE